MGHRICDLPDDMLLKIMFLLPAKDALATQILSKRWRHVPQMLPRLFFKDDQGSESIGLFIDKSLQLHKAPSLFHLAVELGPPCHVDNVDVTKWVEKAVNHNVQSLDFKLLGTAQPITLPMSLYTSKTLTLLSLTDNILVNVSFPVSLPSLRYLYLHFVRYKDDDSLARLLSSSHVLEELTLLRATYDNLTNIVVKVPTLNALVYKTTSHKSYGEEEGHIGSVVIDTPALTLLHLCDYGLEDYCDLIENMPSLDEVGIRYVPNHNAKFLERISSAKRLLFAQSVTMIAGCSHIKFSRLTELFFHSEDRIIWLESLMFFLRNSPALKTLTINTERNKNPPSSWTWNQPSTIPECLSSHLEIVRWKGYRGRKTEIEFIEYILANSKCLKTVEISFGTATCNFNKRRKELKSMPRISTSSQLILATREVEWNF